MFGGTRAIDGVDLVLNSGEVLGIVGPSGAGKSTLARLLVGLLRPSAGAVWAFGERLDLGSRALRRQVQLVFQQPDEALDPRHTAEQALAVATPRPAHRQELLRRVGLPDAVRTRRPSELSGGQKQRLVLARALAVEPRVLVLDEPTSALDPGGAERVLELLSELRTAKLAAASQVLVTHDLSIVDRFAHRMLVLAKGRVVESGRPSEVLGAPRHSVTQALVQAAQTLGLDSWSR